MLCLAWSMLRCIIRRPRPAGTSFSNTSSKYVETCLKVRSIASSFLWSNVPISSWIDFADACNSSLLLRNCSRCFVKLLYCSNAFLFTCPNFLRVSFTECSFLTSFQYYSAVGGYVGSKITHPINFFLCIFLKGFFR